jgi:hypothetical protein
LLAVCALAAACSPSDPAKDASPPPGPSFSAAPGRQTVRRTLDFSAGPQEGDVVARVPYGPNESALGYAPVCQDASCPPPCPCSTELFPAAFDVGDDEIWILDGVKGRVARYDDDDGFVSATRNEAFGLRAFDLQLVGDVGLVLSQTNDFRALFTSVTRRPVSWPLDEETYSSFTASRRRVFTTVFRDEGINSEEIPVEIVFHARAARAHEVPGVPFLDGWSFFEPFAGDQAITVSVSSSTESWARDIRFRLLAERTHSARGRISWERALADDGTMHYLLFAGTYGRAEQNGWWYLTVSADGSVGRPLRLRRTDIDPGGRHLSLGPDGEPYAMWRTSRGVVIEGLSDPAR